MSVYGHRQALCPFEAKLALFAAAGRALSATWNRDDAEAEHWRREADRARDFLTEALTQPNEQLALGFAA